MNNRLLLQLKKAELSEKQLVNGIFENSYFFVAPANR